MGRRLKTKQTFLEPHKTNTEVEVAGHSPLHKDDFIRASKVVLSYTDLDDVR